MARLCYTEDMARSAPNLIHIRVTDELLEKLKHYAKADNRSVPNSVVQLVTVALKQMDIPSKTENS